MNKVELVALHAQKKGITKKEAEAQIDAVFEAFIEGVDTEGFVEITKVIRVEKVATKARVARNPQSGEPVDVAAGFKLKTTLLKKFKEIIGK